MTDDQPLPGVWWRHQRGGAGEVETTPSSPGLGEGGEGIGEPGHAVQWDYWSMS